MAVSIDELQVETQPSAASQGGAAEGQGSGRSSGDLKMEIKEGLRAEMERMQERALRLRAD